MAGDDPRTILHQNGLRRPAGFIALRRGRQGKDDAVQTVKLGIVIVGAVGARRAIFAGKKLQEILRVRIIGQPRYAEHLRFAAFQFLQKSGPVIVTELHHHADFFHEAGQQLGGLARFGIVGLADLQGKFQAPPGGGVLAAGITGGGQQLAGARQIERIWRRVGRVTGHARRHRAVGFFHATVLKGLPCVEIKRAGQGLAEQFIIPHDGIIHVERCVRYRHLRCLAQHDAFGHQLRTQGLVRGHDAVPLVATDLRQVQLSGHEHEPGSGRIPHH